MSGRPNRIRGAPAPPSQWPSIAATLVGWWCKVLRPCRSPSRIWSGARAEISPIAMEKEIFEYSGKRPLSRYHALMPATTKEVVRNVAVTMRIRRKGKDGLKTMAAQSVGKYRPSRISKPAGVCIQLLAERIQKDEISVPSATMEAAKSGEEVHAARNAVAAEQQDAEERRLQEEGGDDL